MADFTITPAQVTAVGSTVTVKRGTAGVTITAGQTVYLDSADSLIKLADANGAGDIHICVGIAMNGATANQPINYADSGQLTLTTGAALGAFGEPVVVSATAGGMASHDDLAAGWFSNILGHLDSTGKILIFPSGGIIRSDVAHG